MREVGVLDGAPRHVVVQRRLERARLHVDQLAARVDRVLAEHRGDLAQLRLQRAGHERTHELGERDLIVALDYRIRALVDGARYAELPAGVAHAPSRHVARELQLRGRLREALAERERALAELLATGRQLARQEVARLLEPGLGEQLAVTGQRDQSTRRVRATPQPKRN